MLEGVLYQVVTKEEQSAEVRLLPESPIYAAHFPGYPITPGVTLVQMALELMGAHLSGAKDIKFIQPVIPSAQGTLLRFEWSLREGSLADVNLFLPDGSLCAKMTLAL